MELKNVKVKHAKECHSISCWASHDSHETSEAIRAILKWQKINLNEERKK